MSRGNTYYTFFIGLTFGMVIAIAWLFREGCNRPAVRYDKVDTITRVMTRPVTIRDTIRVKSVMVKYKDTAYFIERPVNIPCNDTAFIAQSDSVITDTKDTVNMAFSYNNGLGHFSLVFRPRPDSIQTVTVPVIQERTSWEWLAPVFIIGVALGLMTK